MADIRLVSGASLPVRPMPAARAEAIRAAQRAFFTQATTAATISAAGSAQAAAPVTPVAALTRLAFDSSAPTPTAPLRPGSLLDIKV